MQLTVAFVSNQKLTAGRPGKHRLGTHVLRTHAQPDGQTENLMPPARSIGCMEANTWMDGGLVNTYYALISLT